MSSGSRDNLCSSRDHRSGKRANNLRVVGVGQSSGRRRGTSVVGDGSSDWQSDGDTRSLANVLGTVSCHGDSSDTTCRRSGDGDSLGDRNERRSISRAKRSGSNATRGSIHRALGQYSRSKRQSEKKVTKEPGIHSDGEEKKKT